MEHWDIVVTGRNRAGEAGSSTTTPFKRVPKHEIPLSSDDARRRVTQNNSCTSWPDLMNRDRPVGSVAAMVTVKQSRFQNVTNLIPNKVYEISKLRFMTGIIDFRAQHQRSIIHSHLVVGAEICRAAECNATACCYAAMVQANQTKNHIFPIPMRDVMVKLPSTGWDGMESPHPVAVLRDVNHIYGHTVLAGVFHSHPPRFRG